MIYSAVHVSRYIIGRGLGETERPWVLYCPKKNGDIRMENKAKKETAGILKMNFKFIGLWDVKTCG